MNIINYYTSGITANGYISLLNCNLQGLNKVIYVTGEADYSTITDKIMKLWVEARHTLEYIHNPYCNGSLEAIINKRENIAVVFNINPHINNIAKISGNVETVDLTEAIDIESYKKVKDTLIQLKLNKFYCNESAYLYFGKALRVHDEWEKIYISNMNFDRTDELSKELINKLIGSNKADKEGIVKHRFLGAATPEGAVDYIPNLTGDIGKRYFIKGRPGSGKSTLLKKIANNAIGKGYDTEIYHCGFDHNSLDMLIMRELDVCIFDSTAPHEHFPDRANDEIIDVYREAITAGTDEKYRDELIDITERYKSNIRIATSYLKTMKTINDEILKYYKGCINNTALEELTASIIDILRS